MAAAEPEDLPGTVRRRVRDEITSSHILERMVKDIQFLFLGEDEKNNRLIDADVTYLWDLKKGTVANGKSYSEEKE